jgi:hypothetical protein
MPLSALILGGVLSTFPIDLLFGAVLGAISFHLQQQRHGRRDCS